MKSSLEATVDGLSHSARNDDSTRRRLRFEARRHVHVVAIDVIAIDDDVSEMKAHSEYDRLVGRLVAIGFDHGLLEVDGRGERIDGAGELDQPAIALQPDHPSATTNHSGRKTLAEMVQQPRNGATLVPTHQPR